MSITITTLGRRKMVPLFLPRPEIKKSEGKSLLSWQGNIFSVPSIDKLSRTYWEHPPVTSALHAEKYKKVIIWSAGFNFALYLGFVLLVPGLQGEFIAAQALGFMIGKIATFNFVRRWVFGRRHDTHFGEIASFSSIALPMFLINTLLMHAMLTSLAIPHVIAALGAIFLSLVFDFFFAYAMEFIKRKSKELPENSRWLISQIIHP